MGLASYLQEETSKTRFFPIRFWAFWSLSPGQTTYTETRERADIVARDSLGGGGKSPGPNSSLP